MDRKSWIAIFLCFVIFLGWQKFVIEPTQKQRVAQEAAIAQMSAVTETNAELKESGKTLKSGAGSKTKEQPVVHKEMTVGGSPVTFANGNELLSEWKLSNYHDISLQSVSQTTHEQIELAFDLPEYAYLTKVRGEFTERGDTLTWKYEDEKVALAKELAPIADVPGAMTLKYRFKFKGTTPKFAFFSLFGQAPAEDIEAQDRAFLFWNNGSLEKTTVAKATEVIERNAPVDWIALTSRYFLLTLVQDGFSNPTAVKGLVQPLGGGLSRGSIVFPVSGTGEISIPFKLYFGAKDVDVLKKVTPTLDHTVDFGFFTFVAYPLFRLMKFLNDLFHNYGVAIIIMTLIVKMLTYPLTYKSMKAMKDMAKIQPQLTKLREKYKDDKESLNREMMGLMKTHGYNPMAGCLPIAVQMPVFFALYRVLYSSIELYQAPFMFWITDLSAKDPFYVTPALLTITMFIQQKVTPSTAADPMQQKMLQFMPIIFGAFMLTLPSGLTLYMLVNAIASIGQQLILNRKLGMGSHAQPAAAGSRST